MLLYFLTFSSIAKAFSNQNSILAFVIIDHLSEKKVRMDLKVLMYILLRGKGSYSRKFRYYQLSMYLSKYSWTSSLARLKFSFTTCQPKVWTQEQLFPSLVEVCEIIIQLRPISRSKRLYRKKFGFKFCNFAHIEIVWKQGLQVVSRFLFISSSFCFLTSSVVRKKKLTSHWLAAVIYFCIKLLDAVTSLRIKLKTWFFLLEKLEKIFHFWWNWQASKWFSRV